MHRARPLLRLTSIAIAGLIISITLAWTLPDLGFKAESTDRNPVGRRSLIGHWRSWSLTSTHYSRVFNFYVGTPNQPTLPTDSRRVVQEIEAVHFEPGVGPPIHYAPGTFPDSYACWTADFRGFPFRCLWSWQADNNFLNPSNLPLHNSLEIPRLHAFRGQIGYLFPISPMWPGLIADTAFWSVVWFFLSIIPRTIRNRIRASRIRRGLCPSCLYPRDGLSGRCPECGQPSPNGAA